VASWTEITGQPAKQLIAGLTEIDSEVQMEYGLILPRPGDEPAWFADNAAAPTGSRAPVCDGLTAPGWPPHKHHLRRPGG
jgi:hypothetical protein